MAGQIAACAGGGVPGGVGELGVKAVEDKTFDKSSIGDEGRNSIRENYENTSKTHSS